MVYVKYFDILGVDTAQIPCIELQGVPNTATVGAVGLLGMDVTSEGREVYICTAVNGAIYTWQPLKDGKDGSCVVKAEVDSKGELILTLSDGKVINAGYAKGDPGKDGNPGKDGEDGVSVSGAELNTDGELVISLSNGTTTNVGKVVGNDGVSIVKVEMNANYEVIITLSNDTVLNLGVSPITLQGLLGTEPIGEFGTIYYDGEKFVERPYTLEEMPWEQIAKLSESGRAEEFFRVCDEKVIELSTGEKVTLVLLDFNHDDLSDGSGKKAGITFGMKDLLATTYPIHNTRVSVTYAESTMHTSTLPTIFSMLPSDLQSNIKTVLKKNGTEQTLDCQLFLFATSEISTTSSDGLGSRYPYYTDTASANSVKRQKKLNGIGNAEEWWIRQSKSKVVSSGSDYWEIVTEEGKVNGTSMAVTTTNGVCFGFCI